VLYLDGRGSLQEQAVFKGMGSILGEAQVIENAIRWLRPPLRPRSGEKRATEKAAGVKIGTVPNSTQPLSASFLSIVDPGRAIHTGTLYVMGCT